MISYKPDTCGCTFILSADTKEAVSSTPCAIHNIVEDDHNANFSAALEDNHKKNKYLNEVLAKLPEEEKIIDQNGEVNFKHPPKFKLDPKTREFEYDFSPIQELVNELKT
jgi:hypothetical protein